MEEKRVEKLSLSEQARRFAVESHFDMYGDILLNESWCRQQFNSQQKFNSQINGSKN